MKKLLSVALLAGALAFSGCGDSDEFVVINPTNPIPAPVCVDDAYTGSSNQPLIVNAATGVQANDTPNGATLTFSATSANGGTIVGAQDGSFTYTPATGFLGADRFTYTLGNSGGVVTCTVTVTVNAVNGFFVDSTNGNDGTGSFTNGLPFATIQQALVAAPAGSDIVVRPGNYTGTVTLDNGDRLLGSGSVLAQGTPARPVLTGPVVMADGCTLDYLRIANSPGDCVDANGQNNGTVTNCELDTAAGTMQGFGGDPLRGTWTISNNTIQNATAAGIAIRTSNADTLNIRIENNNVNNNTGGGIGFLCGGTSQVNARIAGNTVSSNGTQGFSATCGEDSQVCLDLEDNRNDSEYALLDSNLGTAVLSVEQLANLTVAKPTGAGNTGTVNIASGGTTDPPTDVADRTCGF